MPDWTSVWVSQLWTNVCSMIWKGIGPIYSMWTKPRHTAWRIFKKNRACNFFFCVKMLLVQTTYQILAFFLLKLVLVYQLWPPKKWVSHSVQNICKYVLASRRLWLYVGVFEFGFFNRLSLVFSLKYQTNYLSDQKQKEYFF